MHLLQKAKNKQQAHDQETKSQLPKIEMKKKRTLTIDSPYQEPTGSLQLHWPSDCPRPPSLGKGITLLVSLVFSFHSSWLCNEKLLFNSLWFIYQ